MTLPGREGDRERAAALEEQIKILAETASQALDRVGELEAEVAEQQKELTNYKTEIAEKQQCIEKLSNEVGELMTQSVTSRDQKDTVVTKPCLKCKSRELKITKNVSTQTTDTKPKMKDAGVDARELPELSITKQSDSASRDLHDADASHIAQVVLSEEMLRSRAQVITPADSSLSSSVHSSPSSRGSSRDSSFTDMSDFSDDEIGTVRTVIMSAEQIKAVDRNNLEHHVTQLQRLLRKSQSRDDDLFRMQKLEAALVAVSRARAVLRKA